MIKDQLSKGFSTIVVIIIAAIVLAGIGGAVLLRRPSSTPSTATPESTDATSEEGVEAGETTSTFPDIVGRGQNLECDWRLPASGGETPFGAGKLYTTGNKGRSEIAGNSNGMTIDGNAIYRDETVYSWITVAGTTMGFKFDKAELEELNSSMTPEQKQQAEQIRSEMIFQCKSWTPDESKFVLPTGVEFK